MWWLYILAAVFIACGLVMLVAGAAALWNQPPDETVLDYFSGVIGGIVYLVLCVCLPLAAGLTCILFASGIA